MSAMTYAKAFMRKVLESDVTDSNSFVRKLVDQRYLAFAQAFNFNSDGNVATGKAVVQDKSDEAEVIGLYSEQRVRKGTAVAAEVEYYQARMATITSADDFVSDPRLFEFALTAYGIDASIAMLFLTAFGIKAGLFPLFFWLPASYHTPPAAVGALLAGLLTKVGVYAMIRVFTLLFPDPRGGVYMLVLVLLINGLGH